MRRHVQQYFYARTHLDAARHDCGAEIYIKNAIAAAFFAVCVNEYTAKE